MGGQLGFTGCPGQQDMRGVDKRPDPTAAIDRRRGRAAGRAHGQKLRIDPSKI